MSFWKNSAGRGGEEERGREANSQRPSPDRNEENKSTFLPLQPAREDNSDQGAFRPQSEQVCFKV